MTDNEERFIQDLMVISRNLKGMSMEMIKIIDRVGDMISKYEMYKYEKDKKRTELINKCFT